MCKNTGSVWDLIKKDCYFSWGIVDASKYKSCSEVVIGYGYTISPSYGCCPTEEAYIEPISRGLVCCKTGEKVFLKDGSKEP